MSKNTNQQRFIAMIILASLVLGVLGIQVAQARTSTEEAQTTHLRPQISYAVKHDSSPELWTIASAPEYQNEEKPVRQRFTLPKSSNFKPEELNPVDPALQQGTVPSAMPATEFNFEGVNNVNGVLPPDTNGDVGPNHYVQWVNLSMAIWELDRDTHTANLVYGPTNGNAIWSGFGGPCQTTNDGDPIVLYDHLADRWFISQFALPNYPSGPYYQCIAVSQTPNPTGAWYRYAFIVSNTKMNDYPKFGVWPDGYYMTVNQFTGGASWGGAGVAVYERNQMLLGQTARQVYFDLYSVNSNFGGMLPADLDGPPPPVGTPNYFAEVDDSTWIGPSDAMRVWEFHVDWQNTNNSTFGLAGNPNATLNVTNFTPLCTSTRNCVPQPGTSQRLDAIADRLMHRLQYRYFGTYATLVTNHTVDAGGGRAAVRWYELQRMGSTWSINQQGTYAGDGSNAEHRWMASAAMDSVGNIAIGYSLSSGSVYPSVAYSGRIVSDPPNTLPQGEAILYAGTGSQTHSAARWGDYSMISVDPVDDCTFWFTSEYIQTTGNAPWRTRIGSFVFPACLSGLKGTLQGTVNSGIFPVEGATVEAEGFTTITNAYGFYQFLDIPSGTYTVTVSAYGYLPESVTDVDVPYNATTVLDFDLSEIPMVNVNGTVSDNSGQGWPLYARISINAPGMARTIYTDPESGAYSTDLAEGIEHSFEVSAVSPGYTPVNTSITPTVAEMTQDFVLYIDDAACEAPGYADTGSCTAQPGGLLIGNVYDDNTGEAVNGATVTSQSAPGDSTITFGTPDDPVNDDGFYILFSSLSGAQNFGASMGNYGPDTQMFTIAAGGITTGNFILPAGRLTASPPSFTESLGATDVISRSLTLANVGSLSANFSITEVDAAWEVPVPSGPFATPTRHTSPKRAADLNAAAVYEYNPPQVSLLPGGSVLNQWPTGLAHIWGIGYDPETDHLWVGNVAAGGGDDHLYRYQANGIPRNESIDVSGNEAYFAADMSYNPFTQTLWQINVSGGNCLVEINPLSRALTGNEICPAFDNSQRGLAFNPRNSTYYSGSWNDGVLYHFDSNGTILDSTNLNINISGLAFNPVSEHLFVLSNADQGYDVYILDVNSNYAILGGFDITGMGDFEQAGMSMDCNGHLWIGNQVTGDVFEVDSGESFACLITDIPWLSVSPMTGSVTPGGDRLVNLRIDANGVQAGTYNTHLALNNNTPYGEISIPLNITIEKFYQVAMSPGSAGQTANAGSLVVYQLSVTNMGNATDLYTVSINGNQWSVTKPAQVGPLLAGGSAPINVTVTIPANAIPGATDSVNVRVTSISDPAVFSTTTLTTSTWYRVYLPQLGGEASP